MPLNDDQYRRFLELRKAYDVRRDARRDEQQTIDDKPDADQAIRFLFFLVNRDLANDGKPGLICPVPERSRR